MSRWLEQYQKHPFRKSWEDVKGNLKVATLDDQSVVTSLQELSRLRKAISYLDGVIGSIDPELVPLATWENFHSQAAACSSEIGAFNKDRNIAHIQSANAHVDNLLTYVRPYMVAAGRTAKALRQAAFAYSDSMKAAAANYVEAVSSLASDAKSQLEDIKRKSLEIGDAHARLLTVSQNFLGTSDKSGIYGEVEIKLADLEKKYEDVSELYEEFFDGKDGQQAKKITLKNSVENAISLASKAKSSVEDASESIGRIRDFERRIYGEQDDDGNSDGGLIQEISEQRERMNEFEGQQKIKYAALNSQIESLLPGATSAGLATAYREMKESFDSPIRLFGRIFYAAIGILLIGSILFSIESVSSQGGVQFTRVEEWNAVLRSFVHKLPFYLPVVWLAYYASKRRSECQRLQQEYAHKEALAKSYDSYKKQIIDLNLSDNSMLGSLMQKAIEAISHNASQTLEGRHGDKLPIQDLVEQLADAVLKAKVGKGILDAAEKSK